MDFTSILQYLQGLMGAKQQQQSSQFGQNVGLQQTQLGNQNEQFNKNLAQQGQEFNANLGQQGEQFNKNFGLQSSTEAAKEALANKEFGLTADQQRYQQKLAMDQLNQQILDNAAAQGNPWKEAHPSYVTPPFAYGQPNMGGNGGSWDSMLSLMNLLSNRPGVSVAAAGPARR